MGEKVLHGACAQIRKQRTAIDEEDDCPLNANVGAGQLKHPGFVELIRKALATYDLPGSALILEITEQASLEDLEETSAKLGALRGEGVGSR